ncbi:alpha/beta hydrolase-fold protein [uncultured Draconibacterium sp.]|uniref:alpha/beta hydrolase n=1 Tax=uncultured Draconibacterium sp. TaxID=1573823 RepID=UPI0032173435
MTGKRKIYLGTILLLALTLFGFVYAQTMGSKNESSICIQSKVLGEDRTIWINLPEGYENSDVSYPVLYRLDGNKKLVQKTAATLKRVNKKDENTPEMIVVGIENIWRDKDMWPTYNKYYPESQELGSPKFMAFIEKELIPYMENHYRTSENRILCGQSLSAVFTLYTFLAKPALFDSYIACSGAFPDCEPFFKELSTTAFQNAGLYKNKKLFITHGLKDPLDPDGTVHRQMTDFSQSIQNQLGSMVSCKYLIYENEGHVPKNSLEDGLAYLYK